MSAMMTLLLLPPAEDMGLAVAGTFSPSASTLIGSFVVGCGVFTVPLVVLPELELVVLSAALAVVLGVLVVVAAGWGDDTGTSESHESDESSIESYESPLASLTSVLSELSSVLSVLSSVPSLFRGTSVFGATVPGSWAPGVIVEAGVPVVGVVVEVGVAVDGVCVPAGVDSGVFGGAEVFDGASVAGT